MDTPLSKAHLPPQAPSRVRIRIRPHMGVIGEDRTQWLGDEEHECSTHFARNLIERGIAHILTDEPGASTPAIESQDPAPESHDPAPEHRDPPTRGRRR